MAQQHWALARLLIRLRWRWFDSVQLMFFVLNGLAAGVQFLIPPVRWIHVCMGTANLIAAGFGGWVICRRVFAMQASAEEVIALTRHYRACLERVPATRGVHAELARLAWMEGLALEALHGSNQGAVGEASGDSQGVANLSP